MEFREFQDITHTLKIGIISCFPKNNSLLKKEILENFKKFEEENDVKIKVVEKALAGQIEDLRLDGPAGTGADVITIPGDQIGTAVTEGLLAPLDVSDAVKELYTQSAMQSQIVDGVVYGLPKAVETQILYYNKALISEEELA